MTWAWFSESNLPICEMRTAVGTLVAPQDRKPGNGNGPGTKTEGGGRGRHTGAVLRVAGITCLPWARASTGLDTRLPLLRITYR